MQLGQRVAGPQGPQGTARPRSCAASRPQAPLPRLVCRVATPSREAAASPADAAPAAPHAPGAAAALAAGAQEPRQGGQQDASRRAALQLNVSHYTVDGAALPPAHPDAEAPRSSILIPASHPESPKAAGAGTGELPAISGAADQLLVPMAAAPREAQQAVAPAQQPEPVASGAAVAVADQLLAPADQAAEQQQQPAAARRSPQQQQHQRRARGAAAAGEHQQQHQQQPGGAAAPAPAPRERQPWQRHPRYGQRISPALAVGDVVVGEVVQLGPQGTRVRLLDFEGALGVVPAGHKPKMTDAHPLRRNPRGPAFVPEEHHLPPGHVRAFKVISLPDRMTFFGVGPVLSAAEVDADLSWARLQQVLGLCQETGRPLAARVTGHNSGGLLASFMGHIAFMPFSNVDKPAGSACDGASMVGKMLNVLPTQLDAERRQVTLSERAAAYHAAASALAMGSLVTGAVHAVTRGQALVAVSGMRLGGLAVLGAQHFSCAHTRDMRDHLQAGDPIVAVVVGADPTKHCFHLSTAHLEVQSGDMQRDPRGVFATADRQAAVVARQIREQYEAAAAEAAAAEAAAAAAAAEHAAAAGGEQAAVAEAWTEQQAPQPAGGEGEQAWCGGAEAVPAMAAEGAWQVM